MNCHEAINEFLLLYLDGDLDDERRRDFEEHLAGCPPCVTYLETYRLTIRVSHVACHAQDDPVCIPEALVQAVLAACHRSEPQA
jgi:anti-sigma factor RsiW